MNSFLSFHPEPAIHFVSQTSMKAGHLKAIHSLCTPVFHARVSEGSLIILFSISSTCPFRSAVSSTVPTVPSYLMPTRHIVVILLKTQKCLLPTLQ